MMTRPPPGSWTGLLCALLILIVMGIGLLLALAHRAELSIAVTSAGLVLALGVSALRRQWMLSGVYALGLVATVHAAGAFLDWWPMFDPRCFGQAGTTVDYTPGMTLCPGQSTRLQITIPTAPPIEPGPGAADRGRAL